MKVTVIYIQGSGETRVHKAGCADVKRDLRRAVSSTTFEAASQEEAAAEWFSDFIDEGSMTVDDAVSQTDFLPCTKGL